MTTSALHEGWYPDGKGGQRHWDGLKWDGQVVLPPPNMARRAAVIVISAVLTIGGALGWFAWQHARDVHDQDCRVAALMGESRDGC